MTRLGLVLLGLLASAAVGQIAEAPRTVSAAQKSAIVDSVAKLVSNYYVFPDTAAGMSKLIRENLRNGTYNDIKELFPFCLRLTEDLRSISHDLHLSVMPIPPEQLDPDGKLLTPAADREQMHEEEAYDNFGFREVQRLPGNIGYLKFDMFAGTEVAGTTAIASMNFLGHCAAVIFDLRENGGGDPSMIQLLSSYLFEEPKHLNSFYVRADSSIEQYWTQAFVPGRKLTDVPVYVLTSHNTFSAAEEFTYNLKNMKRAKIVGETTGGGAHPVNFEPVPSLGIRVGVPYGRAINPITGTNWEGVGVPPDLACAASEALDMAILDALQSLMVTETRPGRKYELNWILESKNLMRNPVSLGAEEMGIYAGKYGPRVVTFENGSLYYRRGENPTRKLIAMGNHRFALEGLDNFRIEFAAKKDGTFSELIGHYLDGRTDRNLRE